jgi:hypothetical protein
VGGDDVSVVCEDFAGEHEALEAVARALDRVKGSKDSPNNSWQMPVRRAVQAEPWLTTCSWGDAERFWRREQVSNE